MSDLPLDNIEPGDVPIARPLDDDEGDDVELRFHGLADESATPMMIEATVERDGGDGFFIYNIVELTDDDESFVAEPDRLQHTRVEEAIETAGGTFRHT